MAERGDLELTLGPMTLARPWALKPASDTPASPMCAWRI